MNPLRAGLKKIHIWKKRDQKYETSEEKYLFWYLLEVGGSMGCRWHSDEGWPDSSRADFLKKLQNLSNTCHAASLDLTFVFHENLCHAIRTIISWGEISLQASKLRWFEISFQCITNTPIWQVLWWIYIYNKHSPVCDTLSPGLDVLYSYGNFVQKINLHHYLITGWQVLRYICMIKMKVYLQFLMR